MTLYNISFIENGIGQANLCKAENAEQAKAYFESIAPNAEVIGVTENNESYKPGKPCHVVPDGWTAPEEKTEGEKIIDSLRFTATEAEEQKDLFTPSHTLFKCVIVTTSRRRYTFNYQCNTTHKQPTKEDCLYCLLSDAQSVEYCQDEADFLNEFGYIDNAESIRKGLKAFKACERTKKALDRLFTSEELEALNAHFENY